LQAAPVANLERKTEMDIGRGEVTFVSSMALLATKIVVKNNWIVAESLTRKKWRSSQKLV
jgi:hypothetical protein